MYLNRYQHYQRNHRFTINFIVVVDSRTWSSYHHTITDLHT